MKNQTGSIVVGKTFRIRLVPTARCSREFGLIGMRNLYKLFRPPMTAVSVYDLLDEVSKKRVVIFGEVHGNEVAISLQNEVQKAMLQQTPRTLHVVMEHFNFEMQPVLEKYTNGSISIEDLWRAYEEHGEGHEIVGYATLLESAVGRPERVRLHAGFIPRRYARMVMRDGLDKAIEAAKEQAYIAPDETCLGSEDHYNVFESCISGRSMSSLPPSDDFRAMFPAQIIKDASMAHKVAQLIQADDTNQDRFLIICGAGHMKYKYGVPERIFSRVPGIEATTAMVCSQIEGSGPEPGSPADFCVVLPHPDDEVKQATLQAYDKVGDTASKEGNIELARAMMNHLGYSPEQISVAGPDAYNYQGVGNPHKLAQIMPGEAVLDVGSGLGLDSYIAADAVGPKGSVVGLDLSQKEVDHAGMRAEARGMVNAAFVQGDMEKMPFDDGTFDVIISNGAFCLAPNKNLAFSEVFRVLKPGGRFSICTSVVKMDLAGGIHWPICMKMFSHVNELKPICEETGFAKVHVDDRDSLMAFEIPGTEGMEAPESRSKIHVGLPEFSHLQNYDMNQLCARIVITGTKPFD